MVAIFLAIALAVSLRKILNLFFDLPVIGYSYLSFGSVYITLIFILFYFGVYTKRFDFWHEARIVVRSSFLSFVIVLAGLVLGQNAEYYSRSTLILIFSLSMITIPLLKLFAKKVLFLSGFWKKTAKVISNNHDFESVLFDNYYLGYVKSSDSKHSTLFIDSINLTKEKLDRIIEENIKYAQEYGACDTVVPATDTIVKSMDNEIISEIPDRSKMYQGQTPQSFKIKKLKSLYEGLSEEEKTILTDAAKIFVIKGEKVHLVEGEVSNTKITYPYDLRVAETLISEK